LLQCGAEHHVLDFTRINAGATDGLRHDVARQLLGLRIIKGAAIGPADRGAGCRYDNGVAQIVLLGERPGRGLASLTLHSNLTF
jgi:hypothetical protein